MYGLILMLHLVICLALIGVVLVQSGKGGGLAGGAFGGSATTVFGGRGATDFVTRATMVLGAAFFVTSLALALMSSGQAGTRRSLIQEEARRAATSQPAQAPTQSMPAPGLPSSGQQTPGGPTPATQPPGAKPALPGTGTAPPASKPATPPKTGP